MRAFGSHFSPARTVRVGKGIRASRGGGEEFGERGVAVQSILTPPQEGTPAQKHKKKNKKKKKKKKKKNKREKPNFVFSVKIKKTRDERKGVLNYLQIPGGLLSEWVSRSWGKNPSKR